MTHPVAEDAGIHRNLYNSFFWLLVIRGCDERHIILWVILCFSCMTWYAGDHDLSSRMQLPIRSAQKLLA